jgi:hypothetical protein
MGHAGPGHSAVPAHMPDQGMVKNPSNFLFFYKISEFVIRNSECLHFRVQTVSKNIDSVIVCNQESDFTNI